MRSEAVQMLTALNSGNKAYQVWLQSGSDWPQKGRLIGDFSDRFLRAKMYWNLIWKSPFWGQSDPLWSQTNNPCGCSVSLSPHDWQVTIVTMTGMSPLTLSLPSCGVSCIATSAPHNPGIELVYWPDIKRICSSIRVIIDSTLMKNANDVSLWLCIVEVIEWWRTDDSLLCLSL